MSKHKWASLDDLGRQTIEAFKSLIPPEWISVEWMEVCHVAHLSISDAKNVDDSLANHTELVGYLNRLIGYAKLVYGQKKSDFEELEESKKLKFRNESSQAKQDGTKPERVTIDQINSMVKSDYEVATLRKQVAALEAFMEYLEKISYEALSRWNTLQERSTNRRAGFTKE